MSNIVIYTQPFCGYCAAAKHLLKSKGATWTEIDIAGDIKIRDEMIKKSGGQYTTPQIFINAKYIGGFSDLSRLDADGNLDALLR